MFIDQILYPGIKADTTQVLALCNRLNNEEGSVVRYYLRDGANVEVEAAYLVLPDDDLFPHLITPTMVARVAKAVDQSGAAFFALDN